VCFELQKGAVDRPVDNDVRRKRLTRQVAGLVIGAAALVTVFVEGPDWIRPAVRRSRIRTAVVDRGAIEATVSASGTVVPEIEQVIASPVDARVLRILRRPGASLRKGDPIVALDVSESVLAVERLAQGLALKENEQARTRLALDKRLIDLQGQREIKQLQLESLHLQLARNQAMFKEGLLSEEALRQSEVAERQAVIELAQLDREKQNAEEATRAELAGLLLEMTTLRKERAEAERQLELATARAGRDGVLTWAVNEEGAVVRKGEAIARIADLTSFRVDATVSDVHASRLAPGQPVVVKVGSESLNGTVANINPTIENGAIRIAVALADHASPLLQSNLRVDVLIVTGSRASVLRLAKGPFADGDGARQVFVVRGDRAFRTPVEFGMSSFDRFEVLRGLDVGDEVVVSNMNDYLYLKEVRIR
jgi:HlyD family secretion protein